MSLPDALIFDMDGLLVDSEPASERALIQFLTKRMLDPDYDLAEHLLGRRLPEAIRVVQEWYGLEEDHADLVIEYSQLRLSALREGLPVMPGAREIIAWAIERQIPRALATSGLREHANVGIAAAGLAGLFDAEATGDEVERGKPAPDLFLLAASRLAIEPARCLVFEDAPAGVQAARTAGMRVVWIPNAHSRTLPMPVAPDWSAESLLEARDRLEAMRESVLSAE